MKLQKVIKELSKTNYSKLVGQLQESKGEKYLSLLTTYRENKADENEIIRKLDIGASAFYALKSRLADKVQELLFENTNETRVQLLKNVANVEYLVNKTPRETAIGILKKLEKELLKEDMPNELIIVYKALRKLHIHSQKYYEYSSLYNKYVAFNLGQDKAEELLSSFCKTLSEYYLNRSKQSLNILVLYKKEMRNVCMLYQSHRLHVYENILNIHFALFSPVDKEMNKDETIENMLKETLSIIESHTEHTTYKYLVPIIDFLYFEYYFQLKLYKNAKVYYNKIADDTPALLAYSHSSFTFHFLISKIEFAIVNQQEDKLYAELDFQHYEANIEDKPGYVLFIIYRASAEFYSHRYYEAERTLSKLLKEINFIDSHFIKIEVSLFLVLLQILNGTPAEVNKLLESITRKIAEEKDKIKYRSHLVFIKLLKIALSANNMNKYEELVEQNQYFNDINKGTQGGLPFLKLNDSILQNLVEFVENKNARKDL